ncbi:DUF6709 family protein [Parablautia sp. Marseille-Q6255]|uniref:DUF6709 family protein n=1 Tax=Parablautia sp. Marseille-Q6255 TaxID=3039593 RepID=UPI0024BC95DC|nr:DUF6709 family protein [Parablautia sp. Marseille-Q6255]
MDYQKTIKDTIRKANIKFIVLYLLFALISAAGAYSFYTSKDSIQLLDMIPVPPIAGCVVFLILFFLTGSMAIRTIRAFIQNKEFSDLKKTISEFGKPDEVFSYIGNLEKSPLCSNGDLRFDKKYIAYCLGNTVLIQPMRSLVWGYLQAPAGSSSKKPPEERLKESKSVVLRFQNSATIIVSAKSNENAQQLLTQVNDCCPLMTNGYSAKLEHVYKKDPNRLRKTPPKK